MTKKKKNFISSTERASQCPSPIITLEQFPLFGGKGVGDIPVPAAFFPEEPTDNVVLGTKNRALIKKMQLRTLQSLLQTPSDLLLAQDCYGETSLEKLRQNIRDFLDFHNAPGHVRADTGESFIGFIRILCERSGLSPKHAAVLTGRLGGTSGIVETFEALGAQCHITRTRSQQIFAEAVAQVKTHFKSKALLHVFHTRTRDIMTRFRGILYLGEFAEALAKSMKWPSPVSDEVLREFFRMFNCDNGLRVRYDEIVCPHPCRDCKRIVERLSEAVASSPTGALSVSNLNKLKLLCPPDERSGCPAQTGMRFSRGFLIELSRRADLSYNGNTIGKRRNLFF